MKCIPITWSGRRVRAAISVMEMELVLVARIASGAASPVELLEDRELDVPDSRSPPRPRASALRRRVQRAPRSRSGRAPGPAPPRPACPSSPAGRGCARMVAVAFSSAAGTCRSAPPPTRAARRRGRSRCPSFPLRSPRRGSCRSPFHSTEPPRPRHAATDGGGQEATLRTEAAAGEPGGTARCGSRCSGMSNGRPLTGAASAARVTFQPRCAPNAVQMPPVLKNASDRKMPARAMLPSPAEVTFGLLRWARAKRHGEQHDGPALPDRPSRHHHRQAAEHELLAQRGGRQDQDGFPCLRQPGAGRTAVVAPPGPGREHTQRHRQRRGHDAEGEPHAETLKPSKPSPPAEVGGIEAEGAHAHDPAS